MSKFDLSNIKYVEIPSKGIFRLLRFTIDDKTYIAKTLKEEYVERRQYVALLKKEYEAVAKLHSTYLPVYYELIDDTRLGRCIVEEYIEGRSITDYLAEQHTEEEQERVARQLIDALQSIHQRFMVHRNLKPSNILITKQGDNVKLIDLRPPFADEIQAPFTSTRFQAPEQKDETVAVDTRSDIYSLGLVLRQMTLPDNFAPVIAKCCSLGRTDRYMYAEDVATALDSRPSADFSRGLKWAALVAGAAVIVGAIVYIAQSGISFGSDETPEEATSYILPDTVAADTAKQVAEADTLSAVVPSGCNVDSVKQVIAARLESIYRPYQGDSIGTHSRQQISEQVRNCYYGIMRRLGTVTPEERAVIDQYFAKYRSNKDAQLKTE